MEEKEIITHLNKIFIDVLDVPSVDLKGETTAEDIEEWDSLTHLQLIVAIEKYFKIKFTTFEIQSLRNVGELSKAIAMKLV